jgi:hypothetical protein
VFKSHWSLNSFGLVEWLKWESACLARQDPEFKPPVPKKISVKI